jgi:hypothetical protein
MPVPLGEYGVGQLGALHPRHHDVGEEKVDAALVVAAEREGGLAVTGGHHVVAVALEHRLGLRAQLPLLLHDERRPLRVAARLLRSHQASHPQRQGPAY